LLKRDERSSPVFYSSAERFVRAAPSTHVWCERAITLAKKNKQASKPSPGEKM